MNSLQAVKNLPCWSSITENHLETLICKADLVYMEEGSVITEQFKSATDFYLLCDGSVDHYVTLLTDHPRSIPVGRLDTTMSAIGWSGFLEPNRYTTQTRCSTSATLLHWHYDTLTDLADCSPEVYRSLLTLVTDSSKTLLEQSRRMLYKTPFTDIAKGLRYPARSERMKLKLDSASAIKYLNNSNFFQELKLLELEYLAGHCFLDRYSKGDQLFSEGELASDVMILAKGRIDLYYQVDSDDVTAAGNKNGNAPLFVRSLSQPGHIVSWAALMNSQREDITAVASEDSLLCCIPASVIMAYAQNKTEFAIGLRKKLLQIIGNRLRATRALLIRQHTKNEQAIVYSLLHNLGPQLAIESPLHKVPYLLSNRVTQEDSFYYLDRLQQEGSQLEKNVAGLCSDILQETRREFEFYTGLRSIYQMVVKSGREQGAKVLRDKSASEFAKIFGNTRYLIYGEENLPDTAGHIFIMNHLISHPYHKLTNGFEFSLDSHFVSSMLLYKKYGDSGIRVVRKSRSGEYGHESYYNRLGHIYVYTDESQPVSNDSTRADWRESFFAEATHYLSQGSNVIICPEGTSYWSEQSPGPFKSGAFRLAAMQNPETLIVPVVVANFDKRLSEATLTAVVKPSFKIRDVVDPDDRPAMESFLNTLRSQYAAYVKEVTNNVIA